MLNSKGELVGLLFDGTLDALISDWVFNDKTTRSICLDARYMLWQMKVVDKADRLLKEMNGCERLKPERKPRAGMVSAGLFA
ncbi:hypothetical protein RD2015_3732 [Roseateles depolymerans]|uniref:Uncharacterized protein n=1 Tax=Roseateles depolymerans TaxID=76731 RepID=A0A0U3MUZ8_9BURK|nr:hypothetical protein RD2015_3732 [Roseateles depolymerans]